MSSPVSPHLRSIAALIAISALLVTCRLNDLVTSPPMPVLTISVQRWEDSAAVGSTALHTSMVDVTNTGEGDLPWTVSSTEGSTWLSLSDSSGTVPAAVSVSLDPRGLAGGVYRDTLVVRDKLNRVAPAHIPVVFTIHPCTETPVDIPGQVADAIGSDDCTSPHRPDRFAKVYEVTGSPGDSISVVLASSDFNAHLLLTSSLDSAVAVSSEGAACAGTTSNACVSYFTFRTVEPVFIEATTDTVGETGSFTLDVSPPRPPTDPANLAQLARDSVTPLAIGETSLTADIVLKGVLTDPDPNDTLTLEVEFQPVGTSFTDVPDGASTPITSGDTAVVYLTGLLDNSALHWQARSVDQTGRASSWVSFGGNDESEPDLLVSVAEEPFAPALIGQFRSDLTTQIAVGDTVGGPNAGFKAIVSDPDPADQLRMEIELRPVGVAFTDTPTNASVAVSSGDTARVNAANLADDTGYHWQARTIDQANNVSPWVAFGGNPESDPDFTVYVRSTPALPTDLHQLEPDGVTILALGDTSVADSIVLAAVVSDPDPGDRIELHVEVKPLGTAFNNVPTDSGLAVNSGDTARVVLAGLGDDTDYHWQARGVDQDGNASGWVSYGGNPESEKDFRLQIPATYLEFATQPSNTEVGVSITPPVVVEAREQSGLTDTTYTGAVSIAITSGTGPSGATLSGTTTVTAIAGVATFGDLTIDLIGAGYTFTAGSGGLSNGVSSQFNITPGGADHLQIVTQPSPTAQSGIALAQQPVVQVEDVGGNPVALSGLLVTAAVATGPAGATISADTVSTDSLGLATFGSLAISGLIGDYTLSFTAPGVAAVESDTVTVSAGPATALAIVTQPSDTARSQVPFPQQPVIQLVDAVGNPVARAGDTVTALVASGGASLGGVDSITTDAAGVAAFVDLDLRGPVGPHTLRFESPSFTPAVSDTIHLQPGVPDQIAVSAGDNQSAVAGSAVAVPPAVVVTDADGNAVPGDTVTFAVASGGGAVNPTGPVLTDSAGLAAVSSWTLGTTAGANTLTATSSSPGVTGNPVTFNATATAGSAGTLIIVQQPSSSGQNGIAFVQQPIIAVQDTNGNPVNQSGIAIAASVASGTGGTLIGTTTDTTDASGQLAYADLGLSGPVGSYTIAFSDTLGQLTGVTSSSVTLGAGAADPTTTTATVSSGVAGVVTTGTVIVRDAAGNGLGGGGENVAATVIPGSANAGVTVTVTDNGDSTYALGYTPIVTGTDSLEVTLNAAVISGSPFTSVVGPGAPGPGQSTASVPGGSAGAVTTLVVTARDSLGNSLVGGGQTVGVSITPGSPNETAPITVTDNGDSTYTASYTPLVAGTDTLAITLNGTIIAGGTLYQSVVGPGAADPAQTSAVVPGGTAGVLTSFTVTVRDAQGNGTTGGGETVAAVITGGSPNDTVTVTIVDNGDSTYTGSYTPLVTGTDALAITLNGTAIAGGALYQSVVGSGVADPAQTSAVVPSSSAGALTTFTITVRDTQGNGRTGGGETVAASVTAGSPNDTVTVSVVDNGDSTYTATYTPLVTGTDSLAITLNGTAIAGSPYLTAVGPGAAGAANTTAQVPNGTAGDSTIIIVTARDTLGNSLTGGGQSVGLTVLTGSPNAGAASNIVDNGDSTYTVKYRPTVTGTDTLEITLNGTPVAGSPYLSTVVASTGMLAITTQPSATAQSGIPFPQQPVVQVQDAFGNPVSQSGTTVTAFILSGSPSLGGTTTDTTDAQGQLTFTDLRITGTVGNRTLTFVSSGLNAPESDTVTVTPGNASPSNTSASVPTTGVSSQVTTFTVTARDSSNNSLTGGGETVAATVTTGSPNDTVTVSVVDNGDSTYTASYTPLIAGTDTLAITLNGTPIASGALYQSVVGPGAADPVQTTAVVPAGAAGALTSFTVTVRDAQGNGRTGGGENVAATVTAGSPNDTVTVTVVDNGDSTYTATYTPLLVGTDTLAITLNGTPITGGASYQSAVGPGAADPVQTTASVPAGTSGAVTTFTVTARDAQGNSRTGGGENVAVTITTGSPNDTVTVSVVDNGDSTYTATYTPLLVGTDTLAITLNGTAIAGGTLYQSVVAPGAADPAQTTAVLPAGTSGALTTFTVTVRDAQGNSRTGGGESVAATVTAGSPNDTVTVTVVDNGDSTYTASYTPLIAGTDTLAITLNGTPITGGASYQSVVGPAAADPVQTTAVVPAGTAGALTSFTVTVRDAQGNGRTGGGENVAATVTAGSPNDTVTVSVVDNGDSTYTATYTPLLVGTDTLAITLNGTAIAGGTLYQSVVAPSAADPAQTTAIVPGGTAGALTSFTVTVRDAQGNGRTGGGENVAVTITTGSPNDAVAVSVVDNGDSTYSASYTPLATGTDTLAITLNGTAIAGGTLYQSVVAPGAADPVQTTAVVPAGTAGALTSFTVTVRDAQGNGRTGGGENVAATVTAGSPNDTVTVSVVDNGDSTYTASYTPRIAGTDTLAITLNGTAIDGGTLYQSVVAPSAADPAQTTAVVPGGTAGALTSFTVTVRDAQGNGRTGGGENVAVTITTGSPNDAVAVSVVDNGDSTYTASYAPLIAGTDTLAITLNGTPITGGASYQSVVGPGAADPAQTTAVVPGGTAGALTSFTVTVRDAQGNGRTGGGETVAVTITTGSPNDAVAVSVVDNGDSTYTASYTPLIAGTDTLAITLNGTPITGGASYQSVVGPGAADPAQTTAAVPTGTSGALTTFTVTVRDAQGNGRTGGGENVAVTITTGSPNDTVTVSVVDNGDSTYTASFTPLIAGTDTLAITLNGTPITGGTSYQSVVGPGAADPAQSTAVVPGGTAGALTSFTVTVRDAQGNGRTGGGENVAVTITTGSPNDTVTVSVVDNNDSTYTVSYTPVTSGTDTLAITLNGTPITGGTQYQSVVIAGSATALVLTGLPDPFTSASTATLTVTAVDAFGNVATGYLGTITFTSSDPDAGVVLPADYTFTAGNSGIASFVNGVSLVTTGMRTVTATDTSNSAITGSQSVMVQ